MRALTWHGKRDVRVSELPEPTIEAPNDAIIRVTSTAICGSDLHLYDVLGMFMHEGNILGHEAMGVVEEVGSQVEQVAPGDRVVIPFNISCGHCFMCQRQLYAQCETTQVREHEKGAALFGYTWLYGEVPGAQAEYLRVPQAHFGPVRVPEDFPDERFLYLSDILPTAWQAVEYANVGRGDSVGVFGLGPVGQFCVRVAKHKGARVVGVDLEPARLQMAAEYGVDTIDASKTDDVVGLMREQNEGRGPDATIDAVGMEAHGSPIAAAMQKAAGLLPDSVAADVAGDFGVDRLSALKNAIAAVRRGGTVSIVGVYGGAIDPMPMMQMFDKGIQIRMGQAHVKRWVDDIMPLLVDPNDPLGTENFASHRLPLESGPDAYRMFQEKSDEVVKVVLRPG